MKNTLITVMILCLGFTANGKEIAITFDDSPRAAKGYMDGPTRAKKLITNLKQHGVSQVAFFSVSNKLDTEGIERLKTYSNAGHIIANHTHTHPDFNKLTLEEYTQNFLIADEKLSQFETFRKMFRFPYLREGNTEEKRDGFRKLLKDKSYFNAYITLNNYDWYIETLFQQAIKEHAKFDINAMSKFYVDVLIESIEYYDEMAVNYLDRSPKHVLLLHEMDISAMFIGDLVDELRNRGWKIISVDEAYTDDIAKHQSELVMPYNPGRIGEIARKNGQKKGLWHKTLNEKYLKKRFETEVLKSENTEE